MKQFDVVVNALVSLGEEQAHVDAGRQRAQRNRYKNYRRGGAGVMWMNQKQLSLSIHLNFQIPKPI